MKKNSRKKPPRAGKGEPRRVILVRRERNLRRPVSTAAVRRAVRATLEAEACRKDCSLSVVLAGEETVASLNASFRGVAHATDVLSFSANVVDPETELLYLGDIVISLPRAARQAAARRAPLENEVLLLAVHGTLHLLGHDHAQTAGKRRMWRAQKQILKELTRIA
jgi:probable rRNA maturation factor